MQSQSQNCDSEPDPSLLEQATNEATVWTPPASGSREQTHPLVEKEKLKPMHSPSEPSGSKIDFLDAAMKDMREQSIIIKRTTAFYKKKTAELDRENDLKDQKIREYAAQVQKLKETLNKQKEDIAKTQRSRIKLEMRKIKDQASRQQAMSRILLTYVLPYTTKRDEFLTGLIKQYLPGYLNEDDGEEIDEGGKKDEEVEQLEEIEDDEDDEDESFKINEDKDEKDDDDDFDRLLREII